VECILEDLPERFGGLCYMFRGFCEDVQRALLHKTAIVVQPDGVARAQLQYFTSLKFNAFAQLSEILYPIYSFNLGACVGITDACMMLLCNPEFYANIPLPQGAVIEAHDVSPDTRFFDYEYIMQDGELNIWPSTRMLDEPETTNAARGALGNHLSEIATKFLCLHEQSHYWLGHLHYISSRGPSAVWAELDNDRNSASLPPVISRGLEFQADTMAMDLLLNSIFEPGAKFTPRGLWLPEAMERKTWIFFAVLGMAIVFGIIDRAERYRSDDYALKTHPTAAARFLNLISGIIPSHEQLFATKEEASDWLVKLVTESVTLFKTLGCAPLSIQAVNEYLTRRSESFETFHARECLLYQMFAQELFFETDRYRRLAEASLGIERDSHDEFDTEN
jgi:hypothetical protein